MTLISHMNECVFCKIIKGELNCYRIYESDDVIAFLDINPRAEGHTLIVPKRHVEKLEELNEKELVSLFKAVKEVTSLILSKLNAEGYNLLINTGKVAGQIIPHLHIHILPRRKGDIGIKIPPVIEVDLQEIHKKLVN